ncbi:MAG: amidohydrolase [Anaerolineae bacterium]|nr:amidohydrolase [Anaerolineales bacterium]MCQ3973587.1 amidohydrolase [Anaerolineae bacterium]
MFHHADVLITHAQALTMDRARPRAEAVAVKGERIVFVGPTAEADAWRGPQTQVIDAGDRTLLPGLIDSHFHLLWGSLTLDNIQGEALTNYAELTEAVQSYAQAQPNRSWLMGNGLIYPIGPEQQVLTRHHLDAIIADRPLALMAFDYHTMFANTRALELAGLLHGAECSPGSEIVMGADGLATGELREPGAFGRIYELAPLPDAARQKELLRQGLVQAARYGLTSVHNMNGNLDEMAFYAALEEAGELTLRVNVPFSVTPDTPPEALSEAIAMRDAYLSDKVRSTGVKFFMDGVVESGTALLLEAYAGQPGYCGKAIFEAEQFTPLALAADRLGLQIIVHAIGDGAVRRTLDGYETVQRTNGRRDSRHRIEHIELLHPADLPRFRELGVVASMQPLHETVSVPGQLWAKQVGESRWGCAFPWQTLRASGAPLVFGSDWPIVSQNPYLGIHAALARQPWGPGLPEQAQSLADTLAAYTRDAAYAEFQEGVKGQLRRGMLADMVLLAGNIETMPVEAIKGLSAALTMVGGKIVYQA